MSKFSIFKSGLLLLAAGLVTTSASAQLTTTLDASMKGWYDQHGGSDLASGNFFVGSFEGVTTHNFFVFDRSTNPDLQFVQIRKATLEISLPWTISESAPSYFSTDPNDTGALFSLYKFEGDRAALKSGDNSVSGIALFNDLGADAGGSFGARAVSSADNVPGGLISIDLSAYFLTYINGVTDEFVLGGALSNPNDQVSLDDYEYLFGQTDNGVQVSLRLEFIAVPEPSTYGLIGAAALGLVVWRRRVTKAAGTR